MYGASIVIPTHNQFNSLVIVLRALCNQSYQRKQFEIIVIDDGSTDDLKNVSCVSELISDASINCKLIHTSQRGRSAVTKRVSELPQSMKFENWSVA